METTAIATQAFALLNSQRYAEAADLYRQLCGEAHVPDAQYDAWLKGLVRAYQGLGLGRAAAYVLLYMHHFDQALGLLSEDQPLDAARILEAQGQHAEAGQRYRQQERLLLAAIAHERGGQDQQARECWTRALAALRQRYSTYEAALVYFNLGYCCLRLEDQQGLGYLIKAQRLLEQAADELESAGLRERAFDCYQILLEMGRRSGVFENLSEGYLNCIRILKEDGLKYYVLQYYEDFLKQALEREEFHAAATLYQEAADYCLRLGMLYDQRYLSCAADTWMRAAEKNALEGGPAELSENALLAAVECFNTVGDYHGVGRAYAALSRLELLERKRQRYAGIAARYAGVAPLAQQAADFPEYLRQSHAYPEIWYQDLEELEHDGDPEAICAQVVGDRNYPDVVRRRGLAVLLDSLAGVSGAAGRARLAEGLGDLQIYVVLSPLERLLEDPAEEVQRGVMRALRFLFFKRTFGLLRQGLASELPGVRQEALGALGRLHFRHAFDPLVRIFRESDDPNVRATALSSIGQIPSLEAGDFLIELLRHEPEPLRGQAKQLLIDFENRELVPVLRQHMELESGPLRQDLSEVLQRLGG